MKISPRVLVIAESANPEWVSVPLIGWSLTKALTQVAEVHMVTQVRNRDALLRAGLIEGEDFTAIDTEKLAMPLWKLASLVSGGKGKGWTTFAAISAAAYYYFEHMVWAHFGKAIKSGRFDLVHRITPLSPATPSLLAKRCHRVKVPFVVGPLNGGVPWPKGFNSARHQESEWFSYVRDAYKLMPAYRSTLEYAAAIIVGSKNTLSQIPARHHSKCIYMPENGIDPSRFSRRADAYQGGPLRACFVGRLVPLKGADMLLEAAAPLIREGRLQLDILGDGPLMPQLQEIVRRDGLSHGVALRGWIDHRSLQEHMCRAHLLVLPSIREFGGGVVLEAMALGIAPLVIDYAGPGELVSSGTGFKVPMGKRDEIVSAIRSQLNQILLDPANLSKACEAARTRVQNLFTWANKAGQMRQVYDWVLGLSKDKPEFFLEETGSIDLGKRPIAVIEPATAYPGS